MLWGLLDRGASPPFGSIVPVSTNAGSGKERILSRQDKPMWNSSLSSYQRDDFDDRRYDFDRDRDYGFHGHHYHRWHFGHGHHRWDWDARGYDSGYEHGCHGYTPYHSG